MRKIQMKTRHKNIHFGKYNFPKRRPNDNCDWLEMEKGKNGKILTWKIKLWLKRRLDRSMCVL